MTEANTASAAEAGPVKYLTIAAKAREGRGKGYSRRLRRAGMIPGNLVEHGKSTPIELEPKLLAKLGPTRGVFDLDFDGQVRRVKVQEMQLEAVKREPQHVDLVPYRDPS